MPSRRRQRALVNARNAARLVECDTTPTRSDGSFWRVSRQEADEEWRRLHVVWPSYRATHSTEQTLYFGNDGLIRRHDHDLEIQGGSRGAHFMSDYTEVAGIMVPTKHRIFPRGPEARRSLSHFWSR